MRFSQTKRTTKETDVSLRIVIEGTGKANIKTPISFLSHMLEAFAKHGLFDLDLEAAGDVQVDQHHTMEDIGLTLGRGFREALGSMEGIARSGFFAFPMDESLGIVAVDFAGRPSLVFKAKFKRRMCGDLDTDLVEDFFQGFANGAQGNVAVFVPYGRSDHHKLEAIFKAFGKALQMASIVQPQAKGSLPSTKEFIDRLNS